MNTPAAAGSTFKLIDWENDENKEEMPIQQISPPIDWDDTAARSSFDSPFITKETMNKVNEGETFYKGG
jgi:hypothetical protein